MKVIDLLNKIANGELDDLTHIKNVNSGCKYIYHKKDERFEFCKKGAWNDYFNIVEIDDLNNEIEIIEEKRMCIDCGKYPAEECFTICEYCMGISEENKPIEKLKFENGMEDVSYNEAWLMNCVDACKDKINEVIDILNNLEKGDD